MNTTRSIVILLIVASVSSKKSAAQKQMKKFSLPAGCSLSETICANSTADRSFRVRFKAQCIHECEHEGERSACVGVNYRQGANVCEVYNQCPASYNSNEAGCQYLQREMTTNQNNCSINFGCAYVVPGTGPIEALASYNNQLFVSRLSTDPITVYDSTSLQRLRNITIAGSSGQFSALASSPEDNLLYIGDSIRSSLYAVTLPLNTTTDTIVPKTEWSLKNIARGLSVNRANNVLVAMVNYISEYTTTGTQVHQMSDGRKHHQAVEQGNGTFAVSIPDTSYAAVLLLSTSGTLLKQYGSAPGSGPRQLNYPSGIAVDKDGFILVCNKGNNSVVVLNPTMSEARQLPIDDAIGRINGPQAIWLDQSKGRLYVGEGNYPYRVLVFGNMFHISDTFNSMKLV